MLPSSVIAQASTIATSSLPYQTNKLLRNLINSGEISYSDLHLSESAQLLRYGFYGKLDVAIVEAC